jgi:hypothetical protein
MASIRIHRRLDSETLYLPELKPLIGRVVEIVVSEENHVAGVQPGTGDWDAAAQAVRELTDYDFDAWREQREYDRGHANDYLP